MKKCYKCNRNLDLEDFASHPTRKDGKQGQCRACQKEYRRQHYLVNREKYIKKAVDYDAKFQTWWQEYKTQFSCSSCPESHPACLHFHHPGNNKEGNVSRFAMDGSKSKLLKEIKKCVVLCANCHAKLHFALRHKC